MLIFLVLGIIGGAIFDIGNYVKFLCSFKKMPFIVIDIIETSLCLLLIFFANLKYNYGQIRLFPALTFMISFIIERLTIGKMLAKIYITCYNWFTKIKKRFKKNTNETNKNG